MRGLARIARVAPTPEAPIARPAPSCSVSVLLALLLATAACVAGCINPDRMFGGRWVAIDPVTVGDFSGYPEIGIGHFGPDLVGIVRLYDRAGLPPDDCECTILEARSVRTGAGTFTGVAPMCDDGTWFFSLTIDTDPDEPVLRGTITHTPPGDGSPAVTDVEFERADISVDAAFKACPP